MAMNNSNGSISNMTCKLQGTENMTTLEFFEKSLNHLGWFEYSILLMCSLGIIGNALNLLVLTRKKLVHGMDRLEKCAHMGLAALAVSDMLFCISALPSSCISLFVYKQHFSMNQVVLYYRLYHGAFINTFLMSSTWLTVTMAINRYIVVTYPLQARQYVNVKGTVITVLSVFIISGALTTPYFIGFVIEGCKDKNGYTLYEINLSISRGIFEKLKIYTRWVWPIIASFIPLVILFICNIRLIYELRRAMQVRRETTGGRSKSTSHGVTLTLIIIVLMYLFLVSPSELVKYAKVSKKPSPQMELLFKFFNLLQAGNFAFNFVLYCAVNPTFRATLLEVGRVCWNTTRCRSTKHTGYDLVAAGGSRIVRSENTADSYA